MSVAEGRNDCRERYKPNSEPSNSRRVDCVPLLVIAAEFEGNANAARTGEMLFDACADAGESLDQFIAIAHQTETECRVANVGVGVDNAGETLHRMVGCLWDIHIEGLPAASLDFEFHSHVIRRLSAAHVECDVLHPEIAADSCGQMFEMALIEFLADDGIQILAKRQR